MKMTMTAIASTVAIMAMTPANATTYEDALKTATANNEKSIELDYAWRDTGSIIKQAIKLKSVGLESDAVDLLKRANQQALYAIEQARVGATAKPLF